MNIKHKILKHRSKDTLNFSELLYDIVETVAITTCVILLVFNFIFRIAVVDGDSMEHTLTHGDVLIISDLALEPKYGDIVVFQDFNGYNGSKSLVKRVIASGGQVIDIDFDTWTVTVDGIALDESDYSYIASNKRVLSDLEYPLTVPEGYVFVMGDNRNNSLDSRDSRVGVVDERTIIGRVICRIAPIGDMKFYDRFDQP